MPLGLRARPAAPWVLPAVSYASLRELRFRPLLGCRENDYEARWPRAEGMVHQALGGPEGKKGRSIGVGEKSIRKGTSLLSLGATDLSDSHLPRFSLTSTSSCHGHREHREIDRKKEGKCRPDGLYSQLGRSLGTFASQRAPTRTKAPFFSFQVLFMPASLVSDPTARRLETKK